MTGKRPPPWAQEWPGQPLPQHRAPRNTVVLARAILRRLRASIDLCSPLNIGKGFRRLARGEFTLMASSIRNLIAQRVALAQVFEDPTGADQFNPLPDTPGVPLVSIIIPCFNDGRYVGEAVASALAQTFTDLVVIVVDGGSNDGTTPAIVAALEGPRVRALIRTDGRHLPGDNRNFGIAAATSRYVCCLDSDDILDPTYIEKMLFQLEYRAGDVASSSMRKFGADTGEWRLPERPTFDDFLLGNHALVCSVFRRALWQAAGGYRDSGLGADHVAEDWDFWLRLAGLGARFRNVRGETLMHYRVRDQGQSVSSQSGTRSLAAQGMLIQTRNRHLITDDTRSLSRHQAARQIHPQHDRLPMRLAMRRAAEAAPRPTLLLAIPFFVVGGAERLLSAVVGGLIAAGWRVVVVSTEFDPPNAGDSLPWFAGHAAECYALPRFLAPGDWQDFVAYLIGSRQPDALVIAGSRFLYDMLPKLAEQFPATARLDLLFNTEGHVAKHLEHRAHLTGALCESMPVHAWLAREAAWPDAALACIPSGIDTNAYSPGPRPADLVAQMGIAPDDIVVGWSGRLSEEKAPEIFLALAARCIDLSGVHFVMTGGGPMEPSMAHAASRLPAGTRLHRFGLVDDIRAFYRLYDIYTLTSRIDGRPLAVMEAQASGCAVLASRIGGVPDIMADGVTGLLANPADAADFECTLRRMVADRAGLAAMRAQARALAVDRFSVTAMAEGYRRALENAVAAARIGPPAATR